MAFLVTGGRVRAVSPLEAAAISAATRLADAVKTAGPTLLFGLRLWASVCLALYVAFWLQLDNAAWAGTSAALMCQPHLGASLRKGWFRMIGTVVGAVAIVVLTWCFPQGRAPFLIGLALWGGACALVATLLRNFAAYSAALAGFTAAIIASDELGATGGTNGLAFTLAISRATEICIGIVCAGIVLAATDLGGARRRLAASFAALAAEITSQFGRTLAELPTFAETQSIRRELTRRVIALEPVIDEVIGESAQIRYHSPVLQAAVDGLFAALASWRAVAARLASLPRAGARAQAGAVLQNITHALQSGAEPGNPARWTTHPVQLRRNCEAAARVLISRPAGTPSLRLMADETAKVLSGVAQALDGLALLVVDPAGPSPQRRGLRLGVPDWLPAFVNAGRAFVTIGAVALFWIATGWPGGASAITWSAITVLLFGPRADQAYATAMAFIVGTGLAAVAAAVVAFAAIPGLETFAGFSIVMGLYLVPVGALMAQPWRTTMFIPMAGNFVPILGPANQMSYDPGQFYNAALAIVGGSAAAAMAFRVLPPLSPAFRARRLLNLTLRDLRRLATGRVSWTPDDWQGRVYGRLSVLPDEAQPLQRAQLLAALSVGSEIVRLRRIGARLGLESATELVLATVARGDRAIATEQLARLDSLITARFGAGAETPPALEARAIILAMSDALAQHKAYFDAQAPA